MENKLAERYLYYIFENYKPIYIAEESMIEIVKKSPYFEINNSNQNSFFDSLKEYIENHKEYQELFLIINTNNIDVENQKKLAYMIKDKKYQTLSLPDNCKIIVIGKKDEINKELFSLLVVVDV